MSLDKIIKDLEKNIYCYNEIAQITDVNLICKFMRLKYNNDELSNIANILIKEIEKRKAEPLLWFRDN